MPVVLAIVAGLALVAVGIALRVLRPEAGRAPEVASTGDVDVDASLRAAIPAGSGVGLMLVGMVVVVTALAALVVS